MTRAVTALTFALLGLVLLTLRASAETRFPDSGCVAFSRQGGLAEVDIHARNLTLRYFSRALDRRPKLDYVLNLQGDEWGCGIAFSRDSALLAVTTWTQAQQTQVRVWDFDLSKWVATLEPRAPGGYGHDPEVLGFWKSSHDLALSGSNGNATDPLTAIYLRALNDRPIKRVATNLPAGWADPQDGYFWESEPHSSGCKWRGSALFGGSRKPVQALFPTVQGSSCWADGLLFPKAGLLAGASASGAGAVTVWTSQVGAVKPNVKVIPAPHSRPFVKWSDVHVRLASSPQGDLIAVDRQVTEWSLIDTIKAQWDDLWVFSTRPFKLLEHIPPRGCGRLYTFALNGSLGGVQLVARWCDKWKTETPVQNAFGFPADQRRGRGQDGIGEKGTDSTRTVR